MESPFDHTEWLASQGPPKCHVVFRVTRPGSNNRWKGPVNSHWEKCGVENDTPSQETEKEWCQGVTDGVSKIEERLDSLS